MKKVLVSFFIAITFVFGFFLRVHALTEPQIGSILSMLTSFGVNPIMISNVENALRGVPPSSSSTNSASTIFTQNLSVGDRGSEVRELQIALNKLSCCLISASGEGSLGQETYFFGTKTANAVIRFQNTYKNDILTPNGLSQGTGYFGPSTREKLNELLATGGGGTQSTTNTNTSSNQTPTTTIPSVVPPVVATTTVPIALHISGVSPSSGNDGTQITITGTGFSSTGNTVLTGFGIFKNVPAIDGSIKITINSGIPDNVKKYYLPISTFITVQTNGKSSNSAPFTLTGNSISDAKKEEYKNEVLNRLNLPEELLNN